MFPFTSYKPLKQTGDDGRPSPAMARVGWGTGCARPAVGMKVKMAEALSRRGIGTIVKVWSSGLAQPACRVKWEDGASVDYVSGLAISKGASLRVQHPQLDDSATRLWAARNGVDERILEKLTLGQIQHLAPSSISDVMGKEIDQIEIDELKRIAKKAGEVRK
eukprot:768478-Hanusia_phi.AAC.16